MASSAAGAAGGGGGSAAASGPITPPHFPLLSILVACAAALAHKQLSSIPEYEHLRIVALLGAVGVGAFASGVVHN